MIKISYSNRETVSRIYKKRSLFTYYPVLDTKFVYSIRADYFFHAVSTGYMHTHNSTVVATKPLNVPSADSQKSLGFTIEHIEIDNLYIYRYKSLKDLR